MEEARGIYIVSVTARTEQIHIRHGNVTRQAHFIAKGVLYKFLASKSRHHHGPGRTDSDTPSDEGCIVDWVRRHMIASIWSWLQTDQSRGEVKSATKVQVKKSM